MKKMKKTINTLIAVACLLPTLALAATTVTLTPVADAHVQGGKKAADVNYGSATELRAQTHNSAKSNYDSYLKFDTGTGQVTSARLCLYAALSKSGSVATSAYAVSDTTWSETAITWNTKPALGASLGSVTVASTAYAWQEIDVTAYVQSERAAGRSVISLGLHNEATSSAYLSANSREAANPPQLVVVTNDAPTVSLTAPTTGSSYTAPASVTLTANASDSDGSIASVEFYDGATLIASLTAPPYSYTWNDVPAGSHSLTAKATDNGGAATISTPATISVNAAMASGVYYIYTDHLNTPRVITDANNRTVWRWDSDPFGADKPNEDPDGDGAKFTYNLRFPGQYYDKETGLHYNYFRDYDPTTGRYVQSDPIGLVGGMNTYAYVSGNPLSFTDPLGLKHKANSAHCKALRKKVQNLQNDLDDRWAELAEDRLGLPERIGPGEQLSETKRGHRTLINERESRLRKYEKRYDEECEDDSNNGGGQSCGTGCSAVGVGLGACAVATCLLFPEICIPGLIVGGAATQ